MKTTPAVTNRQRWGASMRTLRREELFKTQAEIAETIVALAAADGVTITLDQSGVSRWEIGDTAPALKIRPYVAKAYGVPVGLLFQELPEEWIA